MSLMNLGPFGKMFSRAEPEGAGSERAKRKHKRGAERHAVVGLQSTLGSVEDLSCSGLRVWTNRQPRASAGVEVPLVLADGDQRMDVLARVMWVRADAAARGGWQIGLKFVDADQEHISAIESYAKFGHFTTDPEVRRRLHRGESNVNDESQRVKPVRSCGASPAAHLTAEVVDLYAMLGIDRGASEQEIHVAYRRLARQLHPDNSDDPDATEKFAQVAKAYSVLKDDRARGKYDLMLGVKRAA